MAAVTTTMATMMPITAGSMRVTEARLARVKRRPTWAPMSAKASHWSGAGTRTSPSHPPAAITTATASAGGPYAVPEGSAAALSASTTPAVAGATYAWDVDGDGQYDDATGQNPTVSAATLAAIGLGDGPDSSSVRVRVTSGSAVITSTATTLTVTNVAPTASLANSGPVASGSTADVSFTAQQDAASTDAAAGFRYAYDVDDDGVLRHQDTSLYRAPSGALVFASGTFAWSPALDRPGHADPRIQRATANLLDRICKRD